MKVPMRPIMVLIKAAWQRFNDHLQLYLSISVLANLVGLVTAFYKLTPSFSVTDNNPLIFAGIGILGLAGIVLSVWGSLALYASIALPDQAQTLGQAFHVGGTYAFKSIMTGILVGLWVLLGLILLIIPGIYWGILYGLATYIVFAEKLDGTAALNRSKELVKPYWFDVFLRQLVFGLIVGIPVIIISGIIGGGFSSVMSDGGSFSSNLVETAFRILLTPLGVLFMAVIYENLVEIHGKK